MPETGSQPSLTANRIASSGPSQKLGIEMPASASVIASVIDCRAAKHGGDDAQRHREHDRDGHRSGRELRRPEQPVADLLRHGRPEAERLSEIAS